MSTLLDRATLIQGLSKALEGGQYNATPGSLVQGGALQVEDLSTVLENVCWGDDQIILQKLIPETACRSTLAQFDRQLAYGQFGGSAGLEGAVGQEDTIDVQRIVVPMCYYSQVRKTTFVADMVRTVDNVSGSDRQEEGAAKVILGDVEFDLFRGMDDFSNGGFFDGNPLALSDMPNMRGLYLQVRQSDSQLNSHDLMFDEFGSDETVDYNVGGPLDQVAIDNARMRAEMNHSSASVLITDPRVAFKYSQISYSISRINLGSSPQQATGAELSTQWTANGPVKIKVSRFLSGKTAPGRARVGGPLRPTSIAVASVAVAATPTSFVAGDEYKYFVTEVNEIGESEKSNTYDATVTATGDTLQVTITKSSSVVRHFNVYRSNKSGTKCRFIGRVRDSGSATTIFVDLNLRIPGFTTSVLLDEESCEMAQLAPFSSTKLGMHELAKPVAYYRFVTLKVMQPRKNVVLSNCVGNFLDQ